MLLKFWMFLVSFLSVFVSSYLLTSMFQQKNERYKNVSFLVLLISMFAEVVLTFEILSVFKAINPVNVLVLNFLFLSITFFLFVKNKSKLYRPEPRKFLSKVLKGLKRDKFLFVMSLGLLFFVFITVLFNIFLPILNFDAMTYHLNRVAFWMSQGSLVHFEIPCEHNLVMPINSEILYLWILVFLKQDIGLRFFAFCGYVMCAFSVYNILAYFGYSERKKLWSVIIFSSFASVVAQASSLETDVLIAGLILSSIYLYLVGLKEKTIPMMFFSSLAYALAIGTKSPAVIALPGVFLLMVFFSYRQNKTQFIRPIGMFLGFLVFNFLIFSSYNYILNFLQYQNFLGSESARAIHGFRGGIKAFVANYIRYIFMMFDFSGFSYSNYLGEYITNVKLAIFDLLRIPYELGVEMSDGNVVNNGLLEVKMGTGLLGFLLFLPSVICSVILGLWGIVKNKVSRKLDMLLAFGLVFWINIACLSFSIAYMVFSVRFLTTMIVLSVPVLVLSYLKKTNIFKFLVLFFVMSYFLVITLNLTSRPFKSVLYTFLTEKTLFDAREKIRCASANDFSGKTSFCELRKIIKNTPKGTKFAILPSVNSRLYPVKMMDFDGYKIDVLLAEKIEQYDLSDYDYLVKTDEILVSTFLLNKTQDTKVLYEVGLDGLPFFTKEQNFYCTYLLHGSYKAFDSKNTNNKEKIIASFCLIEDDYFKEKGFEVFRKYDFSADLAVESNFMTFYKNLKK